MSPPLKDLSNFLILIVLICKHHRCSKNKMAMQAMNWLEGVTGVDITGRSELNTYLGVRDYKHVRTEGEVSEDVQAQDQILEFMENGLGRLDLHPSQVEELINLRVTYTNTLNAMYFHNDQIHILLDDLKEGRAAYKTFQTTDNQLRILNTKLDIEERLSKRYNKQSEHNKVSENMKKLISKYQLDAFVKSQHSGTPPLAKPESPTGQVPYIRPEVISGTPILRRRFISKQEIKQSLMDC